MTMQFRVVHRTRIAYDGGVAASYNEARMTPITTSEQVVVHTRLDVAPTPWSHSYRDYWGTEVTAFEVLDQHSELTVTATSTVQVNRPPQQPGGLGWDEVRSPAVQDRFCETLVVDDRVRPDEELTALADTLAAEVDGPSDFARRVCALVHDEMKYEVGSTKVHGHASDAFRGPVDAPGKRHRRPGLQEAIDKRMGEPRGKQMGQKSVKAGWRVGRG